MAEAGLTPGQISVICFTRGPGMGAPLQSCAIAARTLSLMWGVPLIGVNHCVGRTCFHLFCTLSVTGRVRVKFVGVKSLYSVQTLRWAVLSPAASILSSCMSAVGTRK